ncbi:hypothetical protein C6503_23605 [Candidatus Poribacteria bacterium]|nr:MAG: hypothetical protein C6503_23605 [Candidatus Poribacteria bacterium]
MVIRFKKGKNQSKHKPDTLTCIRDDGSVTWTYLHRGFVHHDFAHYVVETTLGFKNAFFGLVAKGYDIPDFSAPKATRPFKIPKEATDTEPIVALLQADFPNTPYPQHANSNGLFREYSTSLPIDITDEQLEVMQQKLRALLQRWRDLQPGESMVLQFHM